MIFTVSSAAAALRSTQNTCAPSRAKVTAVALPLPQPGPIEPAPTTIAVLPLSRSIDFSLLNIVDDLVARMERQRNPGTCRGARTPPDFARTPSGLRVHYGSHALMVVTRAPTGCRKISDSVRKFPPAHSRHSPAAP